MGASLTHTYDREADILHIDTCLPYAEQESEDWKIAMNVTIVYKTAEMR